MAVLSRLLPSHVGFGFGQIGRLPIGPILADRRLELADLSSGRIEFAFGHRIDVYVIIGFLRRWVDEIRFGNSVRLQAWLLALIRKIQLELRRTDRIHSSKSRHATVRCVPSLVP